ncbi:unnamed protein product, partial [Symbiodinium sp. KB8]
MYGGDVAATTWDEEKTHACVCDSSWEVGYDSDQVQASQWFGPDCSLRRCPSGDDPNTAHNEEKCFLFDSN